MKLQILELDPSDDRASVSDKLSRVQADRVLLVWPRRGKPLSSQIELVFIQRKATSLGIQIGLMSHNPTVIDAARQLNLPLFDSVERASHQDWPPRPGISFPKRPNSQEKRTLVNQPSQQTSKRRYSSDLSNWLRYLLLSLTLLSVLALATVILPSARVELQPNTRERQQNISISLASESMENNAVSLKGQLHSTTITITDRTPTTGTRLVANEFASGQILFTNLTDDSVDLPRGISVRTAGKQSLRFVTTEAAQLPAQQGASSLVSAQAVSAGPQWNIEPEAINTVDGILGLRVQVTNPEGFSGGTNRSLPIVTDSDQASLMLSLQQTVLELGRQRLQESLPTGQDLVAASVQIEEIIESGFDAEPGQPAASLGLEVEAEVSGLAFNYEEITQLLEAQLTGRQNRDWRLLPGTLRFTVEDSSRRADHYSLMVATNWLDYEPVESIPLTRALSAKPKSFEWQGIEEQFDVDIIAIKRTPNWLPFYPLLPNQIHVHYPWQAE